MITFTETTTPENHALMLVELRVLEHGPATCSLTDAAHASGVHPDLLRHYCRIGLFGSAFAHAKAEPVFDDDMIFELRRLEHYRRFHGIERRTLRLLCGLWREVDRLETELRFQRLR
jgi:DNA-binding transcriptional MerR regulator